ncbi:MAG TPA: hypothetical protein VMF52_05135 [Steroidobacteraceae bacterium]|nr:hypothetical protein [Steroidobacteraceae bacterium]
MAAPQSDKSNPYSGFSDLALEDAYRDANERLTLLATIDRKRHSDNAEAMRLRALSGRDRAALRRRTLEALNDIRAELRRRVTDGRLDSHSPLPSR